jgi:Protein of unknown function (DUF2971)
MNIIFSNEAKPERFLYHYTSQAGLLGIIRDKQIWATNVLFLNDSQEVKYAIRLVEKNIGRFGEEKGLDQEEKQFLKNVGKKLGMFDTPDFQKYGGIYTCSFSEKENLLSQWRGYCADGNGFSIGFDFKSSLGNVVEEQFFALVKCEYSENKQIEMIDDFLTRALGHFHESENDLSVDLKMWDDFLALAPRLKDSKFEEEKEWRLISIPTSATVTPKVRFRVGKSTLVPYVNINLNASQDDLNNKEQLSCIPEIYFGPTLYPHLSRVALESLLLKEDVGKDVDGKKFRSKVIDSEIPYRVYSS